MNYTNLTRRAAKPRGLYKVRLVASRSKSSSAIIHCDITTDVGFWISLLGIKVSGDNPETCRITTTESHYCVFERGKQPSTTHFVAGGDLVDPGGNSRLRASGLIFERTDIEASLFTRVQIKRAMASLVYGVIADGKVNGYANVLLSPTRFHTEYSWEDPR
jgi:hypothetical protein